jgi:hypothetical protein|tara:strand:- start:3520 stop:4350 length:831 start_codon:yes stop_codon:yes gene_type:complete
MRLRHNKKRNTAFVYEALVRELTKSAIKNDLNKLNKIKNIIKEHFTRDSLLKKELGIYKSLYETSGMNKGSAEKMIMEARLEYSRLDKSEIFKEQSSLIKVINRSLSSSVFSNFVPNYKNLASLYSIFNDAVDVKQKVMLEEKLLESITAIKTTTKEEKDPIDNLVYKSFVKRFNEKYENQLNEGQKSLLTKYVTSFVDDGLELKMAMNEEIGALKTRIKSALAKPVVAKDKDLLAKTNKVIEILEDYKNKEVDLVMVEEVLKMQSLIEEIENDAN